MNTKQLTYLFLLLVLLNSCKDIELEKKELIYFNDFNSGQLTNIDQGHFIEFNGSQVLGNFNNEGFNLTLENIPSHDYIVISMDLYIHDSWDGNTNEINPPGEDQDMWTLEFDPGIPRKASEDILFQTTFSNGPCISYWCLTQSYPNIYPFVNDPRTGASRTFPGLCYLKDDPHGTTLYKFEKWFPHDRGSLVISMYDGLLQSNVPDPKCDESWSVDNLKVEVVSLK